MASNQSTAAPTLWITVFFDDGVQPTQNVLGGIRERAESVGFDVAEVVPNDRDQATAVVIKTTNVDTVPDEPIALRRLMREAFPTSFGSILVQTEQSWRPSTTTPD